MLCSQTLAEELHTASWWEYDQGDRYSFDFLKRKLPEHTVIMYNRERDDWEAWLQTRLPTKPEVLKVYFHHVCGGTPANAAAALAIKGYQLERCFLTLSHLHILRGRETAPERWGDCG